MRQKPRPITSRLRAAAARRSATAIWAVAMTLWWSTTASAQLDPLLFVKRVPPTVIVVVDTSVRMLEDGNGNFYDPNTYSVAADLPVATALGVAGASTYRRVYQNLTYGNRFDATGIVAVPNTAAAYTSFWNGTRLEIAKNGIASAVAENAGSTFRWGLLKLRQNTPAWRASGNCERPVNYTGGDLALQTASDSAPCSAGGSGGRYAIYTPSVAAPNYSLTTSLGGGAQVVTTGAGTAASVLAVVRRPLGDALGLIPAGQGDAGFEDRPIGFALRDARTAAVAAMAGDSAANRSCRNTVVVLITGGKNDGDATYLGANDASAIAASFMSVASSGVTKRVPIHVIGVRPPAADEAPLQAIASASGGVYRQATTAAEVAAAINYAVQAGFARAADFDTGQTSEFLPVSPVVGTVNLENALSATGTALSNTDVHAVPGGQHLPQRSNIMISAGFTLPGFDGAMRAFRTYRPVADGTTPSGWKFVSDGTRLWPDLDGRPALAGLARAPADAATRNIYTFIPNGSGGGSVVAFSTANAATLAPHMGVGLATSALIGAVRALPLGAIIGSTPAIMDAPSLDPPPDDDYGRTDAPGTFAGDHKDRRSLIFFGANDGMIHAVDARTGYEVWAFIPYNLLPKLRTLADGQPVEQFDYFVDSSPKVAEVKIAGAWRSLLIIGQGAGGTFYQAFDVTEAGMGVAPTADDIGAVSALLSRFDAPDESIQFKWAFPNYSSFDPTYTATFTVADGTPGDRVKVFGDLSSAATYVEKTVGYTWSDPAVGALDANRLQTAVIVGSGYFPDIEDQIPSRGPGAPRAGRAMYLLDVDTGQPIGNPGGGACPVIGSGSGSSIGCAMITDSVSDGRKNALQADPTAAGNNGSYAVNKAYIGDIDGRYWRFNFTPLGVISANLMYDAGAPIYASSALLFIGSTDVYMFFATGSDLLPANAPGGSGTFRLIGLKDNAPANGATVTFARGLTPVTGNETSATGERPSTAPSVAGDIVFYTTTTESAASPCTDFSAKLYALTFVGGAAYDANNNGRIDNNESPVVSTLAGRATAPFIVDQHLYFGTAGATGGARLQSFGDPEDFNNGVGQVGVRILSWREIR